MNGYFYLASPYSHPDIAVMESRFNEAVAAVAWLMLRGHVVFSPIAHSHPVAQAHPMPKDWDFWRKFDEVFVRHASELWVLCIDGWQQSIGVRAEMEMAKANGQPIWFLLPCGESYSATDRDPAPAPDVAPRRPVPSRQAADGLQK